MAVARNADGRMEVFARGVDRALIHNWQVGPNNGWADRWSCFGLPTFLHGSDPPARRPSYGRSVRRDDFIAARHQIVAAPVRMRLTGPVSSASVSQKIATGRVLRVEELPSGLRGREWSARSRTPSPCGGCLPPGAWPSRSVPTRHRHTANVLRDDRDTGLRRQSRASPRLTAWSARRERVSVPESPL